MLPLELVARTVTVPVSVLDLPLLLPALLFPQEVSPSVHAIRTISMRKPVLRLRPCFTLRGRAPRSRSPGKRNVVAARIPLEE